MSMIDDGTHLPAIWRNHLKKPVQDSHSEDNIALIGLAILHLFVCACLFLCLIL